MPGCREPAMRLAGWLLPAGEMGTVCCGLSLLMSVVISQSFLER